MTAGENFVEPAGRLLGGCGHGGKDEGGCQRKRAGAERNGHDVPLMNGHFSLSSIVDMCLFYWIDVFSAGMHKLSRVGRLGICTKGVQCFIPPEIASELFP
jgi:hypothetical protein